VPGGPLNLNSTNLPRPLSLWESSPSGKIPTVEPGIDINRNRQYICMYVYIYIYVVLVNNKLDAQFFLVRLFLFSTCFG